MARGAVGLRPAWGLPGHVLVRWRLRDAAGFLPPCAFGAPVPGGGVGAGGPSASVGVDWSTSRGSLLAGVWPLLSPAAWAPCPPLRMAQRVLGTGWALSLPSCPLLLPGWTPGGVWQGGRMSGTLLSSCRPALRWAEVPVYPRLGAC